LPGRQALADQRAGACGDTASGPDARLRPGADEIMQEPRPRMLAAALGLAADDGGFRACCLRSRRGRVEASPVFPAVTRVIAAGIPAVAGVPVLEEDVPAGQNQARPPMYEMGGLAPASTRQVRSVAWLCWRRAPSAGARHPCEGPGFPAPPTFPGSPPRWCPFPAVRAFLLPQRTSRKSLRLIINGISAIHTVSTERMGLSAPDGEYPPANSQAVHKSRRTARRLCASCTEVTGRAFCGCRPPARPLTPCVPPVAVHDPGPDAKAFSR
jgi:hypothetical protein